MGQGAVSRTRRSIPWAVAPLAAVITVVAVVTVAALVAAPSARAVAASRRAAHPRTGSSTTASYWIYRHGHFTWPGDYSYSADIDYDDLSGDAPGGYADIKVSLTGPWGAWQPYAPHWHFNSRPYTRLTFRLKPTVSGQSWSCQFIKIGDVPVGISVDVADYGPAPVAGRWGTYTIPLSDLGVQGTSIYKFAIQDQTGLSANTWYVNDVGFLH